MVSSMSRNAILIFGALAVLGAATAGAEAKSGNSGTALPHIVFMLVDDLGHNDLGYTNERIRSPTLDQLAATGVKLDQYYTYRFCSPSRSTIMTGRQPYHLGQQTEMNLNPTPAIACGISPSYDFLPALLKRANVSSHALGKWHLGFQSNEYTPTYRGFETYFGYYSGAEEHFTHYKAGPLAGGGMANYFDLANNTGDEVREASRLLVGPNGIYSSYVFGNETSRLIEAHDPNTPFFAYLAWDNVHAPCEAPQWAIDANDDVQDPTRRNFTAMVTALDASVSGVVDALKRKGMWNNTILIVATDNGGNLGGGGNNYPLRGGKYTFWQGGIHGLSFIHSPLLPQSMAGTSYKGLVSVADWYPTIAALYGLGTDNTGPLPVDGINIWPSLLANTSTAREHLVVNVASTDADGKQLKQRLGAVIKPPYKLLTGYPGWRNQKKWDGWVEPPTTPMRGNGSRWCESEERWCAGEEPSAADLYEPSEDKPCVAYPCMFNIEQDPREQVDVAGEFRSIVEELMEVVTSAAASEVSVPASGLCPTKYGSSIDPRCAAKANETGFWVPWLP